MLSQPHSGVSHYLNEASDVTDLHGGEPIRLGRGDDDYTGSPASDVIFGGDGNDIIHGGEGDDDLRGGRGDDVLYGDKGNDRLIGGEGNDRLVGGKNGNVFYGGLGSEYIAAQGYTHETVLYRNAVESNPQSYDTVSGYDMEMQLTVDLHHIDANSSTQKNDAFAWVGSSAFSGTAGELRYEVQSSGGLLQGDIDGDGIADFEVRFSIGSPIHLTENNFTL